MLIKPDFDLIHSVFEDEFKKHEKFIEKFLYRSDSMSLEDFILSTSNSFSDQYMKYMPNALKKAFGAQIVKLVRLPLPEFNAGLVPINDNQSYIVLYNGFIHFLSFYAHYQVKLQQFMQKKKSPDFFEKLYMLHLY